MATSLNQDDYLKTALRLPRELHAKVQEGATESGRSMNAEIVERLSRSFEAQGADPDRVLYLEQVNQQLTRALEGMTNHLAALERTVKAENKFDNLFRQTLQGIRSQYSDLVDDLEEVLGGDSGHYLELDNIKGQLEWLDELLDDAPLPESPQGRLFT